MIDIRLALSVILQLVCACSADYAALSVSRNPPLSSNQTEVCAVYNQKATHLATESQPAPSDYTRAVNSTSYDPYGCTPPPSGLVTNRTLVVLRGNCTFNEKAYLAQLADARMLVVVYNGSQISSPSLNDSIRIPVLMVDNVTGQQILENLTTSPLFLYGYLPPTVPFDPSAVVLMLIAVVTIFLGSFLANAPYPFMRYGLLLRRGEPQGGQTTPEVQADKISVFGIVIGVLLMLALVCGMLLLLYFFYYPMVYIALGFYCLAAIVATYCLLSPFIALIPVIDTKFRLPANKIPILQYRPGPLFPLTILFSVAIVTWWVVERHAPYAWVLQDILGFAFITFLYQRLGFLKPWVVALLMCLLFFYDIFMVFITPYFTKDGVSVMEKAAVGPAGSSEKLPIVFTVMKFLYPTKLDTLCSSSRPYSLLGYGDVGIPGLLVTLGLKHDLTFGRGSCFKIYYATSGIAYIVGLVCTYIALTFMKVAQPALLYLVPTTLISVVIVSLLRREFYLFFSGKPKAHKGSRNIQVKGQEEASHNETSHHSDTDSEKSPLVHSTVA